MGFLAETSDERSNMNSQIDSDSSGSIRPMLSARPDAGNKPSRLGSLFSRKRKLIYASVSQSDLLDRFKKVLIIAVDFAVMFRKYHFFLHQFQLTHSYLCYSKTPEIKFGLAELFSPKAQACTRAGKESYFL